MKSYKCEFCNNEGSRKDIRKCIQTHIKTDKKYRAKIRESKKNSNITSRMIRREL